VLVAAAVCPHPPLLVPGAAAGASAELDDLRAACDLVVGDLLSVPADLVVVVGDAPVVGPYPAGARGSLRPYGLTVPVGEGRGEPILPLSLTIGRWLLDRVRRDVPALLFGVSADASARRCAEIGAALAARAPRVALLGTGDGSARRSVKGPGYRDERAEPFDARVASALRAGDPGALADLDADLAAALLVAGRATWQVLAGAAAGQVWRGELTYEAAPYGVTYLVASWRAPAHPELSDSPG
jgi:hypothetical protein